MYDRTVTYRDLLADDDRLALGLVNHAVILHIRAVAYFNRIAVGTKNRTEPDTRIPA